MNIQSIEHFFKELQDLIKRLTGQPNQMEECRQYCPIKPDRPVQRTIKSSRYYE